MPWHDADRAMAWRRPCHGMMPTVPWHGADRAMASWCRPCHGMMPTVPWHHGADRAMAWCRPCHGMVPTVPWHGADDTMGTIPHNGSAAILRRPLAVFHLELPAAMEACPPYPTDPIPSGLSPKGTQPDPASLFKKRCSDLHDRRVRASTHIGDVVPRPQLCSFGCR